jgi:hypothetical protein
MLLQQVVHMVVVVLAKGLVVVVLGLARQAS